MNFSLLANSLLFLGIMVLLVSLGRVWSLVKALPQGKMQLRWYVLGVMICLFIFGYLGQIILFWNSYTELSLLIVPVIFFCGSLFVWTFCVISLQTTLDLKVVLRENVTDSLTKIYNRLYFDERLVEEVDRADRYHIPLSILMFDIDHFKSVNDN